MGVHVGLFEESLLEVTRMSSLHIHIWTTELIKGWMKIIDVVENILARLKRICTIGLAEDSRSSGGVCCEMDVIYSRGRVCCGVEFAIQP